MTTMDDDRLSTIATAIATGTVDETTFLPFPLRMRAMPPGWLSATDLQILYSFAALLPGPILEIGAWLGRSTAAIAAGIRDSGMPKIFDTVDFGITSPREWETRLKEDFGRFTRNDMVARSIYHPGGSIAVLIENLRKMGLLDHVTSIIRGDSTQVPLRPAYGMIFCDTLHDEREVHAYGAFLDGLLMPGGWLICDDVADDRLGDVLKTYVDFDLWWFSRAIGRNAKFGLGRKRAG